MAELSKITLPNGNTYNFKDEAAQTIISSYIGVPEPLYKEVEWVESNGKQYVFLDWHPPINTWGFSIDFIVRNAFVSTVAAWNPSTNVNGYGYLFGVRAGNRVNDIEFSTYTSTGLLRIGDGAGVATNIKTDQTRQQISLINTTVTKTDGTTATVTRPTENTEKSYANMTVFGLHEGVRKSGYGGILGPSTVRIYSLKFYEGETVVVDLVGAIRKSDGVTGLYDKISKHFYPAPGMAYGDEVGDIGDVENILYMINTKLTPVIVNNIVNKRMWEAFVPQLQSLKDNQQFIIYPMYGVTSSVQTTALAGWDDTSSNSNVYLKLTLADGSITDWIPCYYQGASRLTTHYGSGDPIRFTYKENVFYNASDVSPGSIIVRGFFADPNYNGDRLYEMYTESAISGKNGVKKYSLCMKDDEGNWTTIVNESNINLTGKTCYTGGLQLDKILYHTTNVNYNAGENCGILYDTSLLDFRYDVNGISSTASTTTLQLRKPVYLVGTLGVDGLFYLDTTKWWTQDIPTTEDGKIYIFVGLSYTSYYLIYLSTENPAYIFKNGKFQKYIDNAQKVNGHTVNSDVPSNAVFTDTTYQEATTSTSGLLSSSDKIVIDGINSTYATKTESSNHVVASKTQPSNQQAGDIWLVLS